MKLLLLLKLLLQMLMLVQWTPEWLLQMLHSLPELIAHVSQFMSLDRGDLLFTGTPAGVGPLAEGDTLDARIDGVASLQVVIARSS